MRIGKGQVFGISLVALVLLGTIAYAIFSSTLNITGSASTTGEWDIHFTNATVATEYKSSGASIVLSSDNKTATIAANDLQQPGSYATFSLTVKNEGNIDGKLKSVDITPVSDDPNIKITNTAPSVGSILTAGDVVTFNVTVTWDAASQASTTGHTFSISLLYEQNV